MNWTLSMKIIFYQIYILSFPSVIMPPFNTGNVSDRETASSFLLQSVLLEVSVDLEDRGTPAATRALCDRVSWPLQKTSMVDPQSWASWQQRTSLHLTHLQGRSISSLRDPVLPEICRQDVTLDTKESLSPIWECGVDSHWSSRHIKNGPTGLSI